MSLSPKVNVFQRLLSKLNYIWVLALIVMALVAANVMVSYKNIQYLNSVQSSISNTSEVMMSLDQLHISMLDAESVQRAFLLASNEQDLLPFQSALALLETNIAQLSARQSESKTQQNKINRYVEGVKKRFTALESTIFIAQNNAHADELKLLDRASNSGGELRKLYEEIISKEAEIRGFQIKALGKVKADATSNITLSALLSVTLLLAILALMTMNLRHAKRAKIELQRANSDLEDKVKARTEVLEHYAEELNRSNRELEDFAFVASHDLQEPLRKIRAFGDRIEKNHSQQLDEKGLDYLARMTSAAKRMSTLITDLLELSRVTTRAKPFELNDLNEILQYVQDDLEIAIKESHAVVDIAPLPKLICDASQIHQLFLNLISNALKFRAPGLTPEVKITVDETLFMEQKAYTFVIEDNGIGFEQEYAEKIFSPFQRLHDRNQYAGTGIGLTVCRRIVERHSGVISASAEQGKGAKFSITLLAEPVQIIQELNT